MKRLISVILIVLICASVVLISPVNSVLADSPSNVSQQQLQKDLVKYKYPYSQLPAGERVQLAQFEINSLNEQITNFQPSQGTTMSYLKNALTHMQELLPASSQGNVPLTGITGYSRSAGPMPVAINMLYYGLNRIYYGNTMATTEQVIINSRPEFLVDNSPAGPWEGDANVTGYMSNGIKYFEYLAGDYEGKGLVADTIPYDLQSNLNYISAAAKEGAYGIFLDQVSDGIYVTSNNTYLSSIYNKAHKLGLKVVFNTGVSTWANQLMNYCDYMNSSENWQIGTSLTTIQSKYKSQMWLETQGVSDPTTAAHLTEAAWSKGILAEYACHDYLTLPVWLQSYIAQIRSIH